MGKHTELKSNPNFDFFEFFMNLYKMLENKVISFSRLHIALYELAVNLCNTPILLTRVDLRLRLDSFKEEVIHRYSTCE